VSQHTWYEFKASANGEKETQLFLYDEIGGFGKSAADFIRDLQTTPQDHRLVLRIHSPGGSVLDGNAIVTALKAHPGGLTTHIDGLAASMASVVAIAGVPVRMAGNGLMMIHNVSAGMQGDADEFRKQADVMDKIQKTIEAAYVGKTGLPKKQIREMMDAETWMTAKEAKELGFVDEITGDLKMAAHFDLTKYKNAPSALTSNPRRMEGNLPSEEEAKTIFQKLAAFFTSTQLEAKEAEIVELKSKIATSDSSTEQVATAHATALLAKDDEIAELKTKLEKAGTDSAETEKKINTEVIRRCAAAGVKAPIVRNPEANGAENLEEIRERIKDCTDPKERYELARKAKELRQKAA